MAGFFFEQAEQQQLQVIGAELAAAAPAFVVEAAGATAAEAVVVTVAPEAGATPAHGLTHQVRSEPHECISNLAVRGVGVALMVKMVAHKPSDASLDRS
ncbi:hypothetical protein D3C72_1753250 [compost metagenome]